MEKSAKLRHRQNIGYQTGLIAGLVVIVILFLPSQEKLHVRGPMNTGHEALACSSCHELASGTTRQQIQANVRYFLGLRETAVDFGHQDVDNADCLSCHDRPNDRHPIFRFVEPRFEEARKNIQPQFCTSCHREHTGKRVTIESPYCVNCHEDLTLKKDPITISHEELIAGDNWESCLGCHDFHGNHQMDLNTIVEEAFELDEIQAYFDGGPSPYSVIKYYKAKQERSHE